MRFLLLLAFITSLSLPAFGQTEPEYFDQKFNLLPGKEGAAYYKVIQFADKKETSKTETTYFITGEKQAETKFNQTPEGLFLPEGLAQKWYKNGQLYYTTQYRQGNKEGQAVGYYPGGQLKRRENFLFGMLTIGECFNEDGTPAGFYPHEVLPELPGGPKQVNEFIKSNLKYPAAALRRGVAGTVVVEMIIDETGKLINSKVVNKASPDLDGEVLRVVRAMPNFIPATEEGIAKAYIYYLPVRFGVVQWQEQPPRPGNNNPTNNGFGGGPARRF